MTPLAKPDVYQVGKARPILRTVVHQGVEYERFGPDGWEAPYVVIRGTVDADEVAEPGFHYHLGEEFLAAIDGDVTYQYVGPRGAQELTVQPGSLLRMNCQLPHRNWASRQNTRAWMAIRPETGSTASVGLDTTQQVTEKLSQSISAEDLSNPGKFALVALGLQPRLKIARHRVGLTIDKLAQLCEISQSSASRMEDLKTANVSIHTLAKMAEKLDLDLSRVFPSFAWEYQLGALSGEERGGGTPLPSTVPPVPHYLHPVVWRLERGERIEQVIDASWPELGVDSMHSFIVLSGRVLFDIGDHDAPQPIALNTEGVLHVRDNPNLSLQALTACCVLQFVYSSVCVCQRELRGKKQ
jgi:transcriptional regulator with XRE-family HTH domain